MAAEKKGGFFGVTLLIAGTCMGGGMIGMPILSGLGGFFPAFVMTTVVWLMMLAAALLYFEAVLGMPEKSNMLSISKKYFGKYGPLLVGVPYFIFYFSAVTSYPAGGVPIFDELIKTLFGKSIYPPLSFLFFALFFGGIIYLGTRVCDRVNLILMTGFFITLWIVFKNGALEIDYERLKRHDWTLMFLAGPILFTAFNFHNLIPTLADYVQRDVFRFKISVFLGMTLSYLTYLAWQFLLIGSLSEGTLWEEFERGGVILESLALMAKTPWLGTVSLLFLFFAIVTSLIGMALGVVDFLVEFFRVSLHSFPLPHRLSSVITLFLPAVFLAYFFSNFFVELTGYTGAFGFVILNSIVPIALAWSARYNLNLSLPRLVPGGKPVLFILLFISVYIMYLQGIMISR